MNRAFVVLAISSAAEAMVVNNSIEFMQYLGKYNKSYLNLSEFNTRFDLFN